MVDAIGSRRWRTLTRRLACNYAAGAAAAFGLATVPAVGARAQDISAAPIAAPADAPNMVLFIADDLSWADGGDAYWRDLHGTSSNPVVEMSALNDLIANGVRFRNAFAASATCTTSRSALFTARYPYSNGAIDNNDPVTQRIDTSVTTIAGYFNQIGYCVMEGGKRDVYLGANKGLDWKYIANSETDDARSILPQVIVDAVANRNSAPYGCGGKPLLLIVASHSAHVPWPSKKASLKPNDDQLPPRTPPGLDATATMLSRYYADIKQNLDNADDQCPDKSNSALQTDCEVSIFKKLAEGDLSTAARGNAVFVFVSDQGAQWPFAKWNLYDAGIKTPLIVSWKGRVLAGTSNQLVSMVDILPTMVQIGLKDHPTPSLPGIDGKSFYTTLTKGDPADLTKARVFATHRDNDAGGLFPMLSIRSVEYKLIHNLKSYDDPDKDVYANPISINPPPGYYFPEWPAGLIASFHRRPEWELFRVGKADGTIAGQDITESKNLIGTAAEPSAAIVNGLKAQLEQWRADQCKTYATLSRDDATPPESMCS